MAPKPKKPAHAGPPAQPPDFDIDLSAALPPAPPASKIKKGRGRPRSAAPKPPRKYKVRKDKGVKRKPEPTPTPAPIYINIGDGIDNSNIGEQSATTDLKSKITGKELKFLEIYLAGGKTIDNAMIQAGYGDYSQDWRYTLARRIIQKHETQVGDHRILARAMGAGEVRVLQSLISLLGSKSEAIKLQATAQLAKILGMTQEQVEGAQGITIIFEGAGAQGQPAAIALPAQDAVPSLPDALPYAGKVLQITR